MGEFDTSLILTTPDIRGKKVRDAQWLLAGHNRFSVTKSPVATYDGRIDGDYGPATAGAAKEAKFLLGYPVGEIDNVFGQKLYDYLTKDVLPDDYQQRRAARLVAVNPKVLALREAISWIGTAESPAHSNKTKFGEWYGMNGVPWCAIFVSYCISIANKITWKHSYVPEIAQDAASGRDYMSLTFTPQPGDLVTYNWDGPNCHVELYERALDGYSFSAIGGNTGSENFANGGQVMRSTRYHSNVSHCIRLSLP